LSSPETSTLDAAVLSERFRGSVFAPGDDGYDQARLAFNVTVDQRPALAALPADADDVGELVRFAREHGKRVAPQRTGHNAAPLGSLSDTILLKTDLLGEVSIDAGARRARVGGGAQWLNVVPQASELGLAALHGSAPDVGIAGYTLGGGVGWYGRKLGTAANAVRAIEAVTGEGELVRADADNEPELFWAMRGAGGNFGVVTALEFELFEVGDLYAGVLFFPLERAPEVLHAWREWAPGVPEEVTSVGRVMQFPPLEDIPEPLRGQSFAVVEAVCMMSEEEGRELLRPLRELGPAMDTFASVAPAALADLHMDPPMPVPYASTAEVLSDLSAEALDSLLEAVGPGSGSPLVSVEVRHLGGALSRTEPDAGALACLPGDYLAFGVGMTPEPQATKSAITYLERLHKAIAPYACGGYLNFLEQPYDLSKIFGEESLSRLRAVKAKHDPDNVFHANHALP
jgi:FAD binding domain/Berberine and berberine like